MLSPAPSRWLPAFGLFPLILLLLVVLVVGKTREASTLVIVPPCGGWWRCASSDRHYQAEPIMSHDARIGLVSYPGSVRTRLGRAAACNQWAFLYRSIGYAHYTVAHDAHYMHVVWSYALAHIIEYQPTDHRWPTSSPFAEVVKRILARTIPDTFCRNENESHSVHLTMAGVHIPVERKAGEQISRGGIDDNHISRKNRVGALSENVWGRKSNTQSSENKTHGVGLAGTKEHNTPANLVGLSLANTIIPLNNQGDIPRRNNGGGITLLFTARQSESRDEADAEPGRPSATLSALFVVAPGCGVTSWPGELSQGVLMMRGGVGDSPGAGNTAHEPPTGHLSLHRTGALGMAGRAPIRKPNNTPRAQKPILMGLGGMTGSLRPDLVGSIPDSYASHIFDPIIHQNASTGVAM